MFFSKFLQQGFVDRNNSSEKIDINYLVALISSGEKVYKKLTHQQIITLINVLLEELAKIDKSKLDQLLDKYRKKHE